MNPDEIILGKWTISSINDEEIQTHEGLRFAPNKQYFNIDSQGKIIPSLMEKIWEIKKDTLRLVDFNFEPQFIRTKGTQLYLINELTNNKLDLYLQENNKMTRMVLIKEQNKSTSVK